jgi:hypothetical protein
MKRKSIHPMESKVSSHMMNAFYISLFTMKSSIAFGTLLFPTARGTFFSHTALEAVFINRATSSQQATRFLTQLGDGIH